MKNILLSVIIPVYNTAQYLRECLDSVLSQTYRNLEIICINDGSTDGSGEIIEEYARKDDRIKVIHQENKGLVASRKIGIQLATGEYVSHIDSDDYLEESMYEEMLEKAIEYDVEAVCCGYSIVKGETKYLGSSFEDKGLLENGKKNANIHDNIYCIKKTRRILSWNFWTYLFKRESVINYQMSIPEDIETGEDMAVVWAFLAEAKRVYVLDRPLYCYRIRQGSSSRKKNQDYVSQILKVYKYLEEVFSRQPDAEKLLMIARNALFNITHIMTENYFFGESGRFVLFPYEKVPRFSKIILYGAGWVGKSYYKQLCANKYCEVIAWVDREYKAIRSEYYPVWGIDAINEKQFDYLLIATEVDSTAQGIKKSLVDIYGVSENKIITSAPIQLSQLTDIECLRIEYER